MMYPKVLYGGGAYTVVRDVLQEQEANTKGFYDIKTQTVQTETKASIISNINIGNVTSTTIKRGRPRKAA